MTYLQILNKVQKQEIEKKLKKQFGISEIPGMLVKRGAERIFLFQGDFTDKQVKQLEHTVPIERVGIYFAKEQNNQVRLSIDAIHLFKDQITKNIFELNDEQAQEFMQGNELNISTKNQGFIILKYKENLLGTGKASENKITNFIPKNRRLKIKN